MDRHSDQLSSSEVEFIMLLQQLIAKVGEKDAAERIEGWLALKRSETDDSLNGLSQSSQ